MVRMAVSLAPALISGYITLFPTRHHPLVGAGSGVAYPYPEPGRQARHGRRLMSSRRKLRPATSEQLLRAEFPYARLPDPVSLKSKIVPFTLPRALLI